MYYAIFIIFIVLLFFGVKLKKSKTKNITFIDLNEHNAKLFYDLGNDNLKTGNLERAKFYYTKAIELKPEVNDYYICRGNLYWEIGTPSLAIIDWKIAEKLGSSCATELLSKNKPTHNPKVKQKIEFEAFLNDLGIQYLYNITHKSNLDNILLNGLLSHNIAHSKGLTVTDISDNRVNQRRNKVHNYVPLYFNPKNPMLYKRKSIQSDLIILCIDRNLLQSNIKFSDGNAASKSTIYYTNIKDLGKLNWSIINSEYWSDFVDGKRIRCSEILIPNQINVNRIKKILCFNKDTMSFVSNKIANQEFEVEVNPTLYF